MAKLHLIELNDVNKFCKQISEHYFCPHAARTGSDLFCFVLFALLHRYTPLLHAFYAGK